MTTNHKGLKGKVTSAVRWLAVAAIRAYQVGLRPLNLWGCKFYPSCSHYAIEAFERHGPARGFWLTLKRLLRCRPGTFGGVDPVPGQEEFSQPAPQKRDVIPSLPLARHGGQGQENRGICFFLDPLKPVTLSSPAAPAAGNPAAEALRLRFLRLRSGQATGENTVIANRPHQRRISSAGPEAPSKRVSYDSLEGASGPAEGEKNLASGSAHEPNKGTQSSGSAHGLLPVGSTGTHTEGQTA